MYLYRFIVSPPLGYCVKFWVLHSKNDTLDLENVQKMATKSIRKLKELHHMAKLQHLELFGLEKKVTKGKLD